MDIYQPDNEIRIKKHQSPLGHRLVITTYRTSQVTGRNIHLGVHTGHGVDRQW